MPYLLLLHWGKIPNITDDGPASHHHQQVGGHGMLGAVPEGVAELGVVLDGDGVDCAAHLKGALLELHHTRVVDASAYRKSKGDLQGLVYGLSMLVYLEI